jgi:hypothetical protein
LKVGGVYCGGYGSEKVGNVAVKYLLIGGLKDILHTVHRCLKLFTQMRLMGFNARAVAEQVGS